MANDQSLKEYYKYNIFAVLLGFGGSVWGGPTYFLGVPVVLLTFLKASSFQIGLITAIFWAGFAFPQIWAAYKSESIPIKKRFMAAALTLSSLGFLTYGIYIIMTGAANPSFSIWLFLILFAWACLLSGLYIPPNFTLLFKIIPSARLGQLLGIVFAIQWGGIFVSGFMIDSINEHFAAPINFAALFIITFFVTIIAAGALLCLSEPEGETIRRAPSFGTYIVNFVRLYKNDKLFIKFLIGKWLMSGHYLMQAFLLAYLLRVRGFDPAMGGWFPALNALGLTIGGFTLTRIADIYGPKYMLITSQIAAIIYTLIAWLFPSTTTFVFAAFIITGLAQIADNVGYTNMCLFICPTMDKSTYVAATNIGIIPFMVLLPMIVGHLMDIGVLTYDGTFALSLILMIGAILYLFGVVQNPQAFLDTKMKATAGR